MSAATQIARFGRSFTVTRYATGTYTSGTFVAGATSTFSAVISAQPLTGKDLLNLPEAQRTRNYLKGYSATELFTAQQSSSEKADIVTIDGVDYEVQTVEYWTSEGNTIDPFWKVRLAEVNPQ